MDICMINSETYGVSTISISKYAYLTNPLKGVRFSGVSRMGNWKYNCVHYIYTVTMQYKLQQNIFQALSFLD